MTLTTQDGLALLCESKELPRLAPGKVREIFELKNYPHLLAIYVTDRWSARDFVFGFLMPNAGIIRNIMTIHWKRKLRNAGFQTDLVAYGRIVDDYLPDELKRCKDLWKRLTIVRKHDMIPYEFIYRFNCVGSMFEASNAIVDPKKEMTKTVEFCGHQIPRNLPFGSELPEALPTPTTKEKTGHDKDVTVQGVEEEWPGSIEAGKRFVSFMHQDLANGTSGNLIDIKIEISFDPPTGKFVFCDEMSPDSSRFARRQDYPLLLAGDRIPFRDKEFGRAWADSMGIRKLDPENPADVAFVSSWGGPSEFMAEFMRRYEEACVMNTSHDHREYLKFAMNID